MKEYKVWAFARSAAPNLPALEEQLADVMREADRRGYIIVNSCMEQKCGTEFWRSDLFAMLTAVQQGRYYEIPGLPYDWMSSPPSVNRVLGIWWLGHLLYPELYDYDMVQVAREYYGLFWHYDLTEEEARQMLSRSTLK